MSTYKRLGEIYDADGRKLMQPSSWYLPTIIEYLKKYGSSYQHYYTYYRGKKICSEMAEDEIYAITYGSKEAFLKKYPDGYGQKSLDISKKELLYAFLSVAPPEVAEEHLKVIKETGDCALEYDLGEYVLALANGVSCGEILALMTGTYSSGLSLSWMITHVAAYSLRGEEFLEFYKSVDPTGYEYYAPHNNEEEKTMDGVTVPSK